jgi:type VI secretion system secreted protein Hcp
VTFVEGGVTLPELEVSGYSWGAANPTGAAPKLQDMTLTLTPDTVEPGLWGHLAAGSRLSSATIHVTTPTGPQHLPIEYLTYTLTDVLISSFTTSNDGSGNRPTDTFQLHFGEVREEYFPINADGTRGTPIVADYNQATGRIISAGGLGGPILPAAPQIGLTFEQGVVQLRELAVSGYSWGAANPAGTTPSLQDLTVTLAPGLGADIVEPGLWGHLAAGLHLTSATIHVRHPNGGTEFDTYTLTDVYISSFTTANDGVLQCADLEWAFGGRSARLPPVRAWHGDREQHHEHVHHARLCHGPVGHPLPAGRLHERPARIFRYDRAPGAGRDFSEPRQQHADRQFHRQLRELLHRRLQRGADRQPRR